MASLFTKIIDGDIPAHFVWTDQYCVAFLVIDPLTDGHTIVVPRAEVDHWTDLDPGLLEHLSRVAQIIGLAQRTAFDSARVGLMIQGFEVPHVHLHVWPTDSMADFDLSNVTHGEDQDVLAANAEKLRAQLHADGHREHVPG